MSEFADLNKVLNINATSYLWPDKGLKTLYYELFDIYKSRSLFYDKDLVYNQICTELACLVSKKYLKTNKNFDKSDIEILINKILAYTKENPQRILEVLSSLLAMGMHINFTNGGKVSNIRRPNKLYSTNPNSPILNKLIEKIFLTKFLIPEYGKFRKKDIENLETFIKGIRILDPSFEAGQILLSIISAVNTFLKREAEVNNDLSSNNKLIRLFLEKSLIGFDKNKKAIITVNTLLTLYGVFYKIRNIRIKNLVNLDTLEYYLLNKNLSKGRKNKSNIKYDAIINNPPWGDRIEKSNNKSFISQFEYLHKHKDTYLTFLELSLKSLKEGGYCQGPKVFPSFSELGS